LTVPGAFEIAFCIKNYWDKFKYREQKPHAFIALGCIIRGGTPHFDYVCKAVTEGVVLLNNSLPVPTIFGVLTVDNQQQIDERTGGVHGNKGEEAAIAALKMIALNYSLK
jgi:6,7-dimethyl-8-ribityllumazine synthase